MKEEELRLEQVYCSSCYEFLSFVRPEVVETHSQMCISLAKTAQSIRKEKRREMLVRLVSVKLEKMRYLFMKKTNAIEEITLAAKNKETMMAKLLSIKNSLDTLVYINNDEEALVSALSNIRLQFSSIETI